MFVDTARALIEKAVPQPLARERDLAFVKAQQMLLAAGITATDDMRSTLDDWLVFRRAGDAGNLRMRIVSYADSIETANRTAGNGPSPWLYDGRLKMVGVKLFADGALGSRGACLNAPYADAPKQSGSCLLSDDQLRNDMSRAAMDGFQVAVHAIGDKANAEVLSAVDALADTYKGDRRWRIEHAQIADPADLPKFGQHGIVASMQPIHAVSDMHMAEARLGPDRLAGAYAWRSMLANGVPLAFGSDYPNDDFNPFHGWAAAFTRQDANDLPFGGWQPQQAITREQAWRAYTQGAAYASFSEGSYGTLAPGDVGRLHHRRSGPDARLTRPIARDEGRADVGRWADDVVERGAGDEGRSLADIVMLNSFQHPGAVDRIRSNANGTGADGLYHGQPEAWQHLYRRHIRSVLPAVSAPHRRDSRLHQAP